MKEQDITILHITAHLGGGVGKALSGLLLNTPIGSRIRHITVCLETPEKNQFLDKITDAGFEVFISPDHAQLVALIEQCDIVQLEWWSHPTTISMLCSVNLPPMRLLAWCHISGLHTYIIPDKLITSAHKFIFTSPCTYKADNIIPLVPEYAELLGVVHSCGGFDGFPVPHQKIGQDVSAGYIGSLNFAKLHPQYVDFLKAVPNPEFKVSMIGDAINRDILESQCKQAGRHGLLEFCGYTADVVTELSKINTLVYLLNPAHYGTSENALLEAMAMGIVPIVLDSPAESHIVEDKKTGLIVKNPAEFADAIQWLSNNPEKRQKIGEQASASVRDRFNISRMVDGLNGYYEDIIKLGKRSISFKEVFGDNPADWFLSCQENPAIFTDDMLIMDSLSVYGYYEKTKGSVFHFKKSFPENQRLNNWASKLLKKKSTLAQ
jgi:glycosyltransferase involved in cell wall biosynthesis